MFSGQSLSSHPILSSLFSFFEFLKSLLSLFPLFRLLDGIYALLLHSNTSIINNNDTIVLLVLN